jgi:L-fuculose-phosphate aldolase
MVAVGVQLHANQFIHGRAGNLSARLDHGEILATPAGVRKESLNPDQLLVVDLEGNLLRGLPGYGPTSELPMHLEAYRQRPDVRAVIHAHPIHCIALSLTELTLQDPYIAEALIILGPVPTAPYATPSSTENRDVIAGLIEEHDAIILAHHGSLTVGRSLEAAYERLEVLEHSAEILLLAGRLGPPREIPPDKVEKLLKMRREMLGAGQEIELAERISLQVEEILKRFG